MNLPASGPGQSPQFYVDLLQSVTLLRQAVETEYEIPTGRFCADSRRLKLSSLLKKYELGAWRRAC